MQQRQQRLHGDPQEGGTGPRAIEAAEPFPFIPPGPGPVPIVVGLVLALGLHVAVIGGLARLHPERWQVRPPPTVEMEVIERPPPPPPPIEVQEPPPPPPKPIARRVVVKAPPPEAPPPPPNQEPPPTPPAEPPAPPVFGVTMDSVVTGDSPVAVPVGSTLMTKDRTPGPPSPPAPAPAIVDGPPGFSPVAGTSIGEDARVVHEETGDGYYPRDALRMGLPGEVVMRVGIDRRGIVRTVRVVKKAGYGFDEAATRAMWKFTFTPARTREGAPVDIVITYKYSFKPPR